MRKLQHGEIQWQRCPKGMLVRCSISWQLPTSPLPADKVTLWTTPTCLHYAFLQGSYLTDQQKGSTLTFFYGPQIWQRLGWKGRGRRNFLGSCPSLQAILWAHHVMRGNQGFDTLWVQKSCLRAAPDLQPAVGAAPDTVFICHICIGQGDMGRQDCCRS